MSVFCQCQVDAWSSVLTAFEIKRHFSESFRQQPITVCTKPSRTFLEKQKDNKQNLFSKTETLLRIKREKTTKGLDFYFGSLQFTPDKYVHRIWQLRRTIGKYVVNVRRGRRISYTLNNTLVSTRSLSQNVTDIPALLCHRTSSQSSRCNQLWSVLLWTPPRKIHKNRSPRAGYDYFCILVTGYYGIGRTLLSTTHANIN